jgi:hypothetical protein
MFGQREIKKNLPCKTELVDELLLEVSTAIFLKHLSEPIEEITTIRHITAVLPKSHKLKKLKGFKIIY